MSDTPALKPRLTKRDVRVLRNLPDRWQQPAAGPVLHLYDLTYVLAEDSLLTMNGLIHLGYVKTVEPWTGGTYYARTVKGDEYLAALDEPAPSATQEELT